LIENQPDLNISKPMIAGILLIIAGIAGIVSWIPFIMGEESLISFTIESIGETMTEEQIKNAFTICGSIGILLSIFAILGGILSYKMKKWRIAVICSLLGIFIIGQFLISTGLCVVATIILIISKNEF
jgi:uncharacterized membrane protein